MKVRLLPSALLLASVLPAGCGASDPASPTSISTSTGPSLAVTPSTLSAQAVAGAVCPSIQPFAVAFNLIVTASTAVTVTNITLGFTDTLGVTQPQVTLPAPPVTQPAPIPITQFGSALAQSKAQDFPMRFSFGCSTGQTGALTVAVQTVDAGGRGMSRELTVPVR